MTFTARKTLTALGAAALIVGSLVLGANTASAQTKPFSLSSPDLASGTFDNQFVLNGFGCKGGNVSPALQWDNLPAGTKKLALSVYDPDAPTGSGFWHWTVYNIPASATGLPSGAGHAAAKQRASPWGGSPELKNTGATGGNGNYGGPCPPVGDKPHRYIFTVFAYDVDDLQAAGGIPKTGTAGLHGFILNKGLGAHLLGKASFTATYGR